VLVIDANVAIAACARPSGFNELGDELAAPPLLWSESRSTVHLQAAKGEIAPERAKLLHERLSAAPVERLDPPTLGEEAWRLADEFGWGRTYDAEYVALAKILNCRLVTLDTRLRRGADRLHIVVTPAELRG
jgi:predicted nucleic acid-binding protein